MPKPLVIVESPAKARTLARFLGDKYRVEASYGHIRDLPDSASEVPKDIKSRSWGRLGVDTDGDFTPHYVVPADKKKYVQHLKEALKGASELILATDPDREGEAISWHLQEALTGRKALKKDTPVSRVVFNAITEAAVTAAMRAPREVDMELVRAYLARRALDYLVGFKLSPVLWRKLPGAKSAGRVQSVCLRLIVDREMEIEVFRAREYWSVRAILGTARGENYEARLTMLEGRKLERFDLADGDAAERAVRAVAASALSVKSVEARPVGRNPAPPFITSTLQQEASRKFGLGARATMSAAQRLYEAGLITYMRTDGVDMAPEAVHAARDAIAERFGASYVPADPRMYKNKAKNAQEAHECIRPTDMMLSPDRLRVAEADQRKLYELIWKRTLASQMASARLERTTVEIASADGRIELRATGQVVLFDGFLKVYDEGRDEQPVSDDERRLPQIRQGEAAPLARNAAAAEFAKATADDAAEATALEATQAGVRRASGAVIDEAGAVLGVRHHTQPPPRYTEATLVKRMEELGIGRPSTYASIVSTIQERGYVRKDGNRLIPEDQGRLVTAFLANYFGRYVEYDFTADLEEQLDQVSAGDRDWKEMLELFWRDFSLALAGTADLRIGEVLEKIDEVLGPHLYPARVDGVDPRQCPRCGAGRLSLRTSKKGGAFIGCAKYPECSFTRPLSAPNGPDDAGSGDQLLGHDAGDAITLRRGRFGPYVQRGEAGADGAKPPRASIPKSWPVETIDLDKALMLLNLPRLVGSHPEDGEPVEAAIGRYGPYVRHVKKYANLSSVDEVFTVGMNRAIEVLAAKQQRGRVVAAPLKELGEHPDKGGNIAVMAGRYGPYVKWEKINATLPDGTEPGELTLEQAVELIERKAARGGGRGKARNSKAGAKKAVAKKSTAKQATGKKTTRKKTAKKTAAKAAAGAGTQVAKKASPQAGA